ncbi:histidine phosphatase family protein [Shimia biformata]|uniref:histidine phosphatase family protein n=1 Tax=Shimia biformata TaxID=1294299 RepID=UPI00194F3730|nr:histidine phosphatase family protein [Shimia biformata]
MPNITLVRHGQANSAAKDETSYDQLSDLGWTQARWLGDHMRATGDHFQRIYAGTLNRQVDTARGMMGDAVEIVQDPRLNELSYFTMAQLLDDQQGIPLPDTREGYVAHLPKVFGAWMRDEIADVPERYADFEKRVTDALDDIAAGHGRAVVVTSGGVISLVMRRVLGLDLMGWSQMALAIQNTSVHRLHLVGDRPMLAQFNATPHLEQPDRHHAQTHL